VPIIVAIIIIVVAAILLYFVSSKTYSHEAFITFPMQFGFFKRKKVDKGDEVDLTNWRSAEDATGTSTLDNVPPEQPQSEETSTRRYSNTDI